MTEIFKHVEPGQPVVIQAEEGLKGWVIQERRDGGKDVIINLGQKVKVVPNLDDHPYADNQRHDPGVYSQDSGEVLVVKPAKKAGVKGRERLDPNNRNWPCG